MSVFLRSVYAVLFGYLQCFVVRRFGLHEITFCVVVNGMFSWFLCGLYS